MMFGEWGVQSANVFVHKILGISWSGGKGFAARIALRLPGTP